MSFGPISLVRVQCPQMTLREALVSALFKPNAPWEVRSSKHLGRLRFHCTSTILTPTSKIPPTFLPSPTPCQTNSGSPLVEQ